MYGNVAFQHENERQPYVCILFSFFVYLIYLVCVKSETETVI